jgi:predicted esterase YcpF (UPF0227 family)
MQKHYENCLYIHGLHSNVNPEKKQVLEKYFKKVAALHIDYPNQTNAFKVLKSVCKDENIEILVGSSFGGYLGFYLSKALQIPCILYNPALFFGHQDKIFIPEKPIHPSPSTTIIIGEKDNIVQPETTRKFIKSHATQDKVHLISCSWLEHIIDLNTFETMLLAGLHLNPTAD